MTDSPPPQRGYYTRIMTAGVQLRKKILAVSLKGLGAEDKLIDGKPPVVK
jgi:hypothetical protein